MAKPNQSFISIAPIHHKKETKLNHQGSTLFLYGGTQASVLAVADYPLRVKNAWGSELFNIPNTKVVMHIKPVDKFKAIRRIDKVIGEMETNRVRVNRTS